MTDVVPAEDIEDIVGDLRHVRLHLGRMDTMAERIYILHSKECLVAFSDLRECPFSQALDNGIERRDWAGYADQAVALMIGSENGGPERLMPMPTEMPRQEDVLSWVIQRWPRFASPEWRALKFGEEAGEVLGAVIKHAVGQKTKDDIRTEAAQALICLLALAESEGFDLILAIQDEWNVSQTRVWDGS